MTRVRIKRAGKKQKKYSPGNFQPDYLKIFIVPRVRSW
jgi:hypothetical protein